MPRANTAPCATRPGCRVPRPRGCATRRTQQVRALGSHARVAEFVAAAGAWVSSAGPGRGACAVVPGSWRLHRHRGEGQCTLQGPCASAAARGSTLSTAAPSAGIVAGRAAASRDFPAYRVNLARTARGCRRGSAAGAGPAQDSKREPTECPAGPALAAARDQTLERAARCDLPPCHPRPLAAPAGAPRAGGRPRGRARLPARPRRRRARRMPAALVVRSVAERSATAGSFLRCVSSLLRLSGPGDPVAIKHPAEGRDGEAK